MNEQVELKAKPERDAEAREAADKAAEYEMAGPPTSKPNSRPRA